MGDALELGATDFLSDDEVFEIYTEPEDFSEIREALESKGYSFLSAQIAMIPSSYASIKDEEASEKMQKLLDLLHDNDDVQSVYNNWES